MMSNGVGGAVGPSRSQREPQNSETTVLGIDGNDAEVISSRPGRDGRVDNGTRWDPGTHRASGRRWHRTGGARPGSDRKLFVWGGRYLWLRSCGAHNACTVETAVTGWGAICGPPEVLPLSEVEP